MKIDKDNVSQKLNDVQIENDYNSKTAQDIADFAYQFDKDHRDDPSGSITEFSKTDLRKFVKEMGLSKAEAKILEEILEQELSEYVWDDSKQTSHGNLAKIATAVYDDRPNNLPKGIQLLNYDSSDDASSVEKAGDALQDKIDNADNGLQMKLLENSSQNEIIISFRGTDEAKDWKTNIRKGKQQYEYIAEELSAYIAAIQEEYPNKKITFTGHSLGGGLSEIAGYFAQKENPDADISVVSFNGFGAKPTIKAIEGKENFDNDTLKKLNSVLYRTNNDPVSPLGTHITNTEIELETDTFRPIKDHSMNVVNDFFNDLKNK